MKKSIVFLLFFIILGTVVWGQTTYTWTGAGSSDWDDSDNWTRNPAITPDTYPCENGAEDATVIFNAGAGTVNFLDGANITRLEINAGLTADFTTPPASLDVTDTFVLNGIFTLDNGTINIQNLSVGVDGEFPAANTGSLHMNGAPIIVSSTEITITPSANVVIGNINAPNHDIIINSSGGNVTINGDITGGEINLTAGAGGNIIINGNITGSQVSVTGTSTINANITTTATQVYGAVTLGGAGTRTLTGSTVTLGAITGGAIPLTIAGNAVLSGGNVGSLQITGTAVFQTAPLTAADVSVTGNSEINANITTTATQVYGAVTLGGAGTRTLTGSTVTLGAITGGAIPLTIAGNAVLNGGAVGALQINGNAGFQTAPLTAGTVNVTGNAEFQAALNATSVSITGTSLINTGIVIHTTGNQTYSGAMTLTGTGDVELISDSAAVTIDAGVAGTTTTGLSISAGSNITINDGIIARNIILRAPAGNVTITGAGDITTGNTPLPPGLCGNANPNVVIYVRADNFVSSGFSGIITPGTSGELCLDVNTSDLDSAKVNGSFHVHAPPKHLVYAEALPAGFLPTLYELVKPSDDIDTNFSVASGYNIYIVDVGDNGTREITFNVPGSGFIEIRGEYKAPSLTLNPGTGGVNLVNVNIELTTGSFSSNAQIVTLSGTGATVGSITAPNITLGTITGGGRSLTLNGNAVLNGATGLANLTVGGAAVFQAAISAASVAVTGNSTINADITTTATQGQVYGNVTLGGIGVRTLTATGTGATVTLGVITGNGLSLTIAGNAVLNGGNVGALQINGTARFQTAPLTAGTVNVTGNAEFQAALNATSVSITGTSLIGADIAIRTTGNQTYTGDITLGGATGNLELNSSTGNITIARVLETGAMGLNISAGGNIASSNGITARSIVFQAPAGNVTITGTRSIEALGAPLPSGYCGYDIDIGIYVRAINFDTSGFTGAARIDPGISKELCLDVTTTDLTEAKMATGRSFHQHIPSGIRKIIYSFVEDSNGNGKVDRIRVQTSLPLNGDFSGFRVAIEGYTVRGINGYEIVYDTTGDNDDKSSFYIYLEERSPYLYDGKPLLWRVTQNNSLYDDKGKLLVGDPASNETFVTINTIPPRISYALTLPGHNETYIRMSQGVSPYSGSVTAGGPRVDPSGLSIHQTASSPSYNLEGFSLQDQLPSGVLGYRLALTSAPDVSDLAGLTRIGEAPGEFFTLQGLMNLSVRAVDLSDTLVSQAMSIYYPSPRYPKDWNYSGYAEYKGNSHVNGLTPDTNPSLKNTIFIPPYQILTPEMMRVLEESAAGNTIAKVTPGMFSGGGDIVTRRITDVLVSVSPEAKDSPNYFAWSVWAMYNTGGSPAPDTIGSIWEFNGTKFLEDSDDDIALQAMIFNTTSGLSLFYGFNVPAGERNPAEGTVTGRSSGGLWLPRDPSPTKNVLFDIVPSETIIFNTGLLGFHLTASPLSLGPSASQLVTFDIPTSTFSSGGKVEFFFRLEGDPAADPNLFIARLDAPPGVIPSNWFELVRPFSFDIQNVRRQRGGVTILNNVINSNIGEVTYLRYNLVRPGRVTIQIYTLDGTLIKSLVRNEQREAGDWTEEWNGTNNGGRPVARGMYFIRVVGPDIDEIRKVMVIR